MLNPETIKITCSPVAASMIDVQLDDRVYIQVEGKSYPIPFVVEFIEGNDEGVIFTLRYAHP